LKKVAPHSPAWTAGLSKGDEILAVNGTKVEKNLDELANYFSSQVITLTVMTPMKKEKHFDLHTGKEKYYHRYFIAQK
jgi:predicted metalloprotease with PDZ domain